MSTDIAIGRFGDTFLDAGNDLATVSDTPRLEQHIYLSIGEQLQSLIGEIVTGNEITEIERGVEQSLSNAQDVDEVISATLERYEPDTNTLSFTVQTAVDTEALEITL